MRDTLLAYGTAGLVFVLGTLAFTTQVLLGELVWRDLRKK